MCRKTFTSVLLGLCCAPLAAAPVTFTQLTGLTGGTNEGTAVYRADLSAVGLGTVQSITIQDSNSGLGGSTGEFSGFDLDGIKLSNAFYTEAAPAAAGVGLAGFDFTNTGTLLIPGAQRIPVDPKLFGTGLGGSTVDFSVATLGDFDGENVAGPGADGFISLGDGGRIIFNLSAPVSTAGLYLYIGEVGNNGEVAAGSITISDTPQALPLPVASVGGAVLLCGVAFRRSRCA